MKTFLLIILVSYVRNESCREKLAPISLKSPNFVAFTDFLYIDEDFFAINRIQPKFLSVLLTGYFVEA